MKKIRHQINAINLGFALSILAVLVIILFCFLNAQKTISKRETKRPIATFTMGQEQSPQDRSVAVQESSATVPTNSIPVFSSEDEMENESKVETEIEKTLVVEEMHNPRTEQTGQIALVMSDMGLSSSATEKAIETLPKPVTLAFAPYVKNIEKWVHKAHKDQRDILVSIPMEPESFPLDDPGPNALLTSLSDEENIRRLDAALSKINPHIGIVNFMGSSFTAHEEKLTPIIKYLSTKTDIVFLDSGNTNKSLIPMISSQYGLEHFRSHRFIDNIKIKTAIIKQLQELEKIALNNGYAIGIGFPSPVTYDAILEWYTSLAKDKIQLVPLSKISKQ